MQTDECEMQRALDVLYQPDDLIELRSLGRRNLNGYYRDRAKLIRDAQQVNDQLGQSVFVVLNPIQPDLYARRADDCGTTARGEGAKDNDIARCRWLMVDVDADRASGISATDEEKAAAQQKAIRIYQYLATHLGNACLVVCDSGNGFHILVLIDRPNDRDTAAVCRSLIQRLADQFGSDATTHNASRLTALYGSIKRKGSDLPDRPHRPTRLLRIPDQPQAANWATICELAAAPQVAAQPVQQQQQQPAAGLLDIDALLEQQGIAYDRDDEYETDSGEQATRWILDTCPWDEQHTDRAAWIIRWAGGSIAAGCHHNGCAGRSWDDLRQLWGLAGDITAADIILPVSPMSHMSQHSYTAAAVSPMPLQSFISPPSVPTAAFYGPLGEICLGLEQHTEASPIAVLACSLMYLGNLLGRQFFCQLDQWHFGKLYVALVGATGSGRKGTADYQARQIIDAIDPTAALLRHSGLSTGEGLLELLDQNREGIYPRPAVFTEREFAGVFRRAERKGNTLSTVIRDAWDDTVLENSTKANPVRIADHHVSLCVHVTPAELIRLMSNLDCSNGFANRFVWIYSRRTDRRPNAVGFQAARFARQLDQLRSAVDTARQRFQQVGSPICLPFSLQASTAWEQELYPQLDLDSEEDTQLVLMCNRQPQQVCRIALILALADGLPQIELRHLQAAQAMLGYVWESLDYILSRPWWGDASNSRHPAGMVERLLQGMQAGPQPRSHIMHGIFNRHRTAAEINALRDLLISQGRLRVEQDGRTELWHLL